jgi:hypothetical protein
MFAAALFARSTCLSSAGKKTRLNDVFDSATLVSKRRAISPTVNNSGRCDIDFLAASGKTSQRLPVDGQAVKPRKSGTKIFEVIARVRGEGQIQKKLAAKNRGRARSRVAELVAGWLAERFGVRAIGIMEIEAGLSNLFYRLDLLCRREGRHIILAPQNTVKKFAAKTLDGLDEKRVTTTDST